MMTRKGFTVAWFVVLALCAVVLCASKAQAKDILPATAPAVSAENCVDVRALPSDFASAFRAALAPLFLTAKCPAGEARLVFTPPAVDNEGTISVVAYLDHAPLTVEGGSAAETAERMAQAVQRAHVKRAPRKPNAVPVALAVEEGGEPSCVVDNPPFVREFVEEDLRSQGLVVEDGAARIMRLKIVWRLGTDGSCQAQEVVWSAHENDAPLGTMTQYAVLGPEEFERGLKTFSAMYALHQ